MSPVTLENNLACAYVDVLDGSWVVWERKEEIENKSNEENKGNKEKDNNKNLLIVKIKQNLIVS